MAENTPNSSATSHCLFNLRYHHVTCRVTFHLPTTTRPRIHPVMPLGAGVSTLTKFTQIYAYTRQVNCYHVPCGLVPNYGQDSYPGTPFWSKRRTSHQTSHPSPMVTAIRHVEDTRNGLPQIFHAILNLVEHPLDLQRQENRPMRCHSFRDRGYVL